MTEIISRLLPVIVLLSHIVFAILVLATIFRETWGKRIIEFVGERGIPIALFVALATVLGSMFYSLGLGFPPCELCWWQRIFLFPTLVILLVAWRRDDRQAFSYILPLALLAGLVSVYQIYAQLGGTSILNCTASEGECLKVYVNAFGYITIPVMGLTSAAYLSLISLISKKHG